MGEEDGLLEQLEHMYNYGEEHQYSGKSGSSAAIMYRKKMLPTYSPAAKAVTNSFQVVPLKDFPFSRHKHSGSGSAYSTNTMGRGGAAAAATATTNNSSLCQILKPVAHINSDRYLKNFKLNSEKLRLAVKTASTDRHSILNSRA